jgi:hypothetical protein
MSVTDFLRSVLVVHGGRRPRLSRAGRRGLLHGGLRGIEVIGHEGPHEQAVLAQEELVFLPTGVAQGRQHLGPDGGVPSAVLVQPVGPDLQGEADAGHDTGPSVGDLAALRWGRAAVQGDRLQEDETFHQPLWRRP